MNKEDRIVKVNIDGKDYYAQISSEGIYSIAFPYRVDSEGYICYDHLENAEIDSSIIGEENNSKGLRFTSVRVSSNDEDNRFIFWVLEDGTMLAKPNGKKVFLNASKTSKKFDKLDVLDEHEEVLAREIYHVFDSVVEFDRLGRFAKDVYSLREKYLNNILGILGYDKNSDINQNPSLSRSLFSLRKVGEFLESYSNLSYVHEVKSKDGYPNYFVDYDRFEKQSNSPDQISEQEKLIEIQTNYIEFQEEWLRKIRGVPMAKDFLLNVEQEIIKNDPEGWENYNRVNKNIARLVLELNYDLLDEDTRRELRDLTGVQEDELRDIISNEIDSEDYAKACLFEDKMVKEECDRVTEYLDDSVKVGKLSIPMINKIRSIYSEVLDSRAERDKAIKSYNSYRNIYEDRDSKSDIKHSNTSSIVELDENDGEER